MSQTILIYHGNCPDGFLAATIFRQARGNEVEFHAGVHQEPPPDVTDKEVVFVDFSYKRPVILALAEQADSILVVDHHISAQEDLVDLPTNVKTIFDMNRSGAGLAWEIFQPGQPTPKLVLYVEALDLWRLEAYPHLKEVIAGLLAYDYDFDLWTQFLTADQDDLIARLAQEGTVIERRLAKDLQQTIASGQHQLEIGGQLVPAVNVPATMSAAANQLAPDQPFAACYYLMDDYAKFSLRSDKNGADVAQIAAQYGGGGHRHAAGFSLKYTGTELNEALKQQFGSS